MEDRILVEVYFPSLLRSFDILIPCNVRFYQISDMIERSVSRITSGRYVPSGNAMLCDRNTGMCFDVNLTARDMCLHNGSSLLIL